MKVGTDGVLLGAWATSDRCQTILDLGTGSGLIALMLAQRYPLARIDAIDIDADAVEQAILNFSQSPFATRVQAHHSAVQDFLPSGQPVYDLIVSNPPYFEASLKSPSAKRSLARHTDSLSVADLAHAVSRLLLPSGHFCVVLPYAQRPFFIQTFRQSGLHLHTLVRVCPKVGASPKRVLMAFAHQPCLSVSLSNLTIEADRHIYTDEFRALVSDFYLKL